MQHTIRSEINIKGIGLHSGKESVLRILPAPADHGILFIRSDIDPKEQDSKIPAKWDNVTDTMLCTVISNKDGASVGTIEHLMAALRGCGIDNAVIEVNTPELPVLDGSSTIFVKEIEKTGTRTQSQPRRAIRILKKVTVRDGEKEVSLSPYSGSSFSGVIDFDHPDIGKQNYKIELVNGNFKHDIADCRTFGFLEEVEAMRAAGLAKGGSLENAVVVSDNGIMNPEGLRCSDEFIRHKLLDAIGDIYLAGGPVIGSYEGKYMGHAINNALLHKLFADETAWEMVDMYVDLKEKSSSIYSNTSHKSKAAA
jgi:UDP-3-O-[3-hydroxymyristoyl] N-acetylglucosamine deacetylase